ncbi:hypothetical protein FPV67DRAFT_1492533 [Lyophyllum atratum]|nr:hypothetical protein FPV67DRAFT_1492533 [Lyophyllum atratum]
MARCYLLTQCCLFSYRAWARNFDSGQYIKVRLSSYTRIMSSVDLPVAPFLTVSPLLPFHSPYLPPNMPRLSSPCHFAPETKEIPRCSLQLVSIPSHSCGPRHRAISRLFTAGGGL